jgi:hypothetical protein
MNKKSDMRNVRNMRKSIDCFYKIGHPPANGTNTFTSIRIEVAIKAQNTNPQFWKIGIYFNELFISNSHYWYFQRSLDCY